MHLCSCYILCGIILWLLNWYQLDGLATKVLFLTSLWSGSINRVTKRSRCYGNCCYFDEVCIVRNQLPDKDGGEDGSVLRDQPGGSLSQVQGVAPDHPVLL